MKLQERPSQPFQGKGFSPSIVWPQSIPVRCTSAHTWPTPNVLFQQAKWLNKGCAWRQGAKAKLKSKHLGDALHKICKSITFLSVSKRIILKCNTSLYLSPSKSSRQNFALGSSPEGLKFCKKKIKNIFLELW